MDGCSSSVLSCYSLITFFYMSNTIYETFMKMMNEYQKPKNEFPFRGVIFDKEDKNGYYRKTSNEDDDH